MFLEPRDFPFVEPLQAAWREIRHELQTLPRDEFLHYGLDDAHTGDWLVFPLVHRLPGEPGPLGEGAARNAGRCPVTEALLDRIPDLLLAGFSLLGPGARIFSHSDHDVPPAHRCHLGLVSNPGARFALGGQVRPWLEGECLVFDSGREHEAVNEGPVDRVILLLDVLAERYPARPASW